VQRSRSIAIFEVLSWLSLARMAGAAALVHHMAVASFAFAPVLAAVGVAAVINAVLIVLVARFRQVWARWVLLAFLFPSAGFVPARLFVADPPIFWGDWLIFAGTALGLVGILFTFAPSARKWLARSKA
jgi:hypothetical protein